MIRRLCLRYLYVCDMNVFVFVLAVLLLLRAWTVWLHWILASELWIKTRGPQLLQPINGAAGRVDVAGWDMTG